MHSAHTYAAAVARHDIAEVVGARDTRYAALTRSFVFGVFRRYRNGVDHRVVARDVRRVVRLEYLDAAVGKAARERRLGAVGAARAVAAQVRDMRERRHIYPADADKKYAFAAGKHSAYLFGSVMCIGCGHFKTRTAVRPSGKIYLMP